MDAWKATVPLCSEGIHVVAVPCLVAGLLPGIHEIRASARWWCSHTQGWPAVAFASPFRSSWHFPRSIRPGRLVVIVFVRLAQRTGCACLLCGRPLFRAASASRHAVARTAAAMTIWRAVALRELRLLLALALSGLLLSARLVSALLLRSTLLLPLLLLLLFCLDLALLLLGGALLLLALALLGLLALALLGLLASLLLPPLCCASIPAAAWRRARGRTLRVASRVHPRGVGGLPGRCSSGAAGRAVIAGSAGIGSRATRILGSRAASWSVCWWCTPDLLLRRESETLATAASSIVGRATFIWEPVTWASATPIASAAHAVRSWLAAALPALLA